MDDNITFVIERMRTKNPDKVSFPKESKYEVNVKERIDNLELRGKKPLIYHQVNVSNTYVTINCLLKVDDEENNRIVIIGRHAKMPLITDCDFLKVMSTVNNREGKNQK